MFDPVTISAAVATASTAFSGIKRAFQAGRDLESMTQDLSRWMGAVSDVDAAHKSAKNPTMFRKVFGGGTVEQEAIEAFAAKRSLKSSDTNYNSLLSLRMERLRGMSYYVWRGRYASVDSRRYMIKRYLEKRLLASWHLPLCLLLAWVFWPLRLLPYGTRQGMVRLSVFVSKAVRKHLNGSVRMKV